MHLVIVNQYGLPKGQAGITRHGDLGAELVRRGHDVTVIASSFHYLTRSAAASGRTADDVHDGVRFRWLDTGSYSANDRERVRSMLAFTIRAFAVGLRLRPRPDVILASSPHLLAGLAGAAVARLRRVPFLFEVRDLWPQALVDLGAIRSGGLTNRLLELVERLCYRFADRIVTVPPHADRRVRERGEDGSKCLHIPNATALTDLDRAPLPGSLEASLAACAGQRILMCVGAQGVSNGLEVVIGALDELRAGDPETYAQFAVVFIGDGGEHDRLVRAASASSHRNVHFHPPIPKAAVPTALDRAALLLVSFADAAVYGYGVSPNKLFDYLYAGRPVLLATRSTDDPVSEADAGRTFEPGSPTSLASRIRELLRLPERELAAMGARGRSLVERRYTLARTGQQLAELLEQVVVARP